MDRSNCDKFTSETEFEKGYDVYYKYQNFGTLIVKTYYYNYMVFNFVGY